MQLTTEDVQRFVGGQMVFHRRSKLVGKRCYCGEIANIRIQKGHLIVKLAWVAERRGLHGEERWVKAIRSLDRSDNIKDCSVSINQNTRGDGYIVVISNLPSGFNVLYPKNGNKLNPAEVVGLQLVAQA